MDNTLGRMPVEIRCRWTEWDKVCLEDPDLVREMADIRNDREHCEERIRDAFYRDLEFGTGGLRGIMGAGSNRVNIYTVARASRGYADYLKCRCIHEGETGFDGGGDTRMKGGMDTRPDEGEAAGPEEERHLAPAGSMDLSYDLSLAIAYDSRLKSEEFARTAAEVFAAAGIQVYFFPELVPTPVLSFAVRYLGCDGGVVITASHNPAQYNGYKVYGADGGQITGAAAKGIYEKITGIDIFAGVERLEFSRAVDAGKVVYVGRELMEAYYKAVSREAFGGELDRGLDIVYTPLNGTGLKPVSEILKRNGFTNVKVVEEQREPDGNFPTCPCPNPEKEEAMSLALRDAALCGSDLVLATDPDCDRVGIAVRSAQKDLGQKAAGGREAAGRAAGEREAAGEGEAAGREDAGREDACPRGDCYRLLSGNETGVLLLNYVGARRREVGRMPRHPIAFKTIVTTDLACKVAEAHGVEMRDVLTGFKYIGEQLGALEAEGGEERFILGLEESYGYLAGTSVRDKDGVISSLLICEMTAYYKQKGMTLEQVLDKIYQKYGYYLNTQHTFVFPGESGSRRMEEIMGGMRDAAMSFPEFGKNKMIRVDDYLNSAAHTPEAGAVPLALPQSNVLKMTWEDGTSLTIRPSGTEPKLKIYISAIGAHMDDARRKEKELMRLLKGGLGL